MHVIVLIKQVPQFEALELGADGRLRRDGLEVELNPYCRRAVAKGVELAAGSGGRCTVITLGPPAAEDCLREAIAWGADDGVLVSDPAFAGSDTLATSRALAMAVRLEGGFDLILTGRNSVDADTGQVGPQVAAFLGMPFLGAVRELAITGGVATARCELDDGWQDAEVTLPAVLSCAERLCDPAKVPPSGRAEVPPARIRHRVAAELGAGPWGAAGSPTSVGDVRSVAVDRAAIVLRGPVRDQVDQALAILAETGALDGGDDRGATRAPVRPHRPFEGPRVDVLAPPDQPELARELLGVAAELAHHLDGYVTVVTFGMQEAGLDAASASAVELPFGPWGADTRVHVTGAAAEEDLAEIVAARCAIDPSWAVLVPSTMWGREVASRVAVRLGAGLTGDAVDLTVEDRRLVAWKPAFGGQLVAAVRSSSPVQVATVRPGVLPRHEPRPPRPLPTQRINGMSAGRVRKQPPVRDDDLDVLAHARVVVGVGAGVPLECYPELDGLLAVLAAELGATRKVTDRGWLPRARQIGITGRAIAPSLYVGIGLSGKFNHLVGVRAAGQILAINGDPDAPVFAAADVGIVGDWREAVGHLVTALHERHASSIS